MNMIATVIIIIIMLIVIVAMNISIITITVIIMIIVALIIIVYYHCYHHILMVTAIFKVFLRDIIDYGPLWDIIFINNILYNPCHYYFYQYFKLYHCFCN